MIDALTIALAQINSTVGDIRGNCQRVIDWAQNAAAQGADLVVFPEMAITGYPAEDLLFKKVFQQAAMQAVYDIKDALASCPAAVLIGAYMVEEGQRYNAAVLIDQGEIIAVQYKYALPNYGVFDEKRLFTQGDIPTAINWRGTRLGILICEDLWQAGLAMELKQDGAEFLISLNASPFELGKMARRKEVAKAAVNQTGLPLLYCNMVCGQDELVFDGRSFAMNGDGKIAAQAIGFEEALLTTTLEKNSAWSVIPQPLAPPLTELEEIYSAMVLGLRDYVEKNNFKGVVIGLSGGIDSGLTAAVAVDALGAEKVQGILMSSPYTSQESIEDAEQLAKALAIKTMHISIEQGMKAYAAMLEPVLAGTTPDSTEENIQARIRGNLLMAFSNKHGFMVLTTGNKSEMSVGYATLYGDMCGGYSVLKDVYKTSVFRLSRWRNNAPLSSLWRGPQGKIIPERMISKPPSAELRPNQKDEDSLPAYEILDGILNGLIEERLAIADMVAQGYDLATVERVAQMIYTAEYKRRQAPPGVKISGMAFGRDRRYPITNRWIWQRTKQ